VRGGWRLTPCGRKSISQSREVIHPRPGNSAEYGIVAQGKIADKHSGMAEGLVEGIWIVKSAVECLKLKSACRTFGKGPCVIEKTVQVI
jgi:hypothetical protein